MSLKRFLIIIVAAAAFTNLLVFAPSAHAQYSTGTLAQHVWFDALGSREDQEWGYSFMTALPAISDSIPHPMAISENAGASAAYILNRFPVDTQRIYTFPGGKVVSGHISGSPYTDFVCWDVPDRRITVLFGTAIDSIFDTALVLQGSLTLNEFGGGPLVVGNFDSSNVQGFVIGDVLYQDSIGIQLGRILYYKGGNKLSQEPTQVIYGVKNQRVIGTGLFSGKLRDPFQEYLIEANSTSPHGGGDTFMFYLYKYGQNFNIENADDSLLNIEGGGTWGFIITDATGDSIDDILAGAGGVKIFAGGQNISPQPSFLLNNLPFPQNSGEFGDVMCNVGDVSGNGYDYLLVANTTQNAGDGAVYLYPIGKNLKDTCLAYAVGADIMGGLGSTIAAVGDVNGDNLADFYVGGTSQIGSEPYDCGEVIAYLGNKGYVSVVSEKEKPLPLPAFILNQNYPNPFSTTTEISFAVSDFAYNSKPVTLDVFDMQGRKIANVYSGSADLAEHVIQLDASRLSAGNYFYRLSGGGIEKERMFTVFR